MVKDKVSKAIGAMYRVKEKVNEEALLMIYNTLVLPHLQYCCELWGNTYDSRINDLVVAQKRAIRLIDKVKVREHTTEIFKNYKLLKFKDLINFQTSILMYKASNIMLPQNVQVQFCKNQDVHKHCTRNKEKVFVSSVNTRLKKKMSTNVIGVKLWNELSSEIKESSSLNIFKRKLKYEYISKY